MYGSTVLCSLALLALPIWAANEPPLEGYNVDTSRITISGFSAGGAFATQVAVWQCGFVPISTLLFLNVYWTVYQFHVAYSSLISGMGSWAGVANTCFASYSYFCLYYADFERVQSLIKNTEEIAGRIDDVANLARDHVYIMHGSEDTTVDTDAAQLMSDYYAEYLDDHGNQLVLNLDIPSTHAVQSDHTGTACGTTNNDLFIENCDFNRSVAICSV